ncbi:hypothetical protein LV75_003529 [Actinokineospora diospyrosa]|uniref:Uncharacterized protein n=2 Tax=Actinokineospora diospyrosa TaxID=103728 RepID=A0ABT1IEF6_9PSEU|nr:hypothetical protein [Actinokineospora diospyrosa]
MRGAGVVRFVAAVLAGAAVCASMGSLLRFTKAEHMPAAVSIELRDHAAVGPVPPVRFLVTITGVNPVERRINATVTVKATEYEDRPVFVDSDGRPVVDPKTGELRAEFADLNLTVTLYGTWLDDAVVSYPLAKVLAPSTLTSGVSVAIPAEVDPSRFPNDLYSLDLSVTAFLPLQVGVTSADTQQHPTAAHGSIPVMFGVAVDNRLSQWDFDTDMPVTNSRGPTGLQDIAIVLGRGWTSWLFIYAVSLMPAIIGAAFAIRTRNRRGTAGDASAAMELAAALIALIALRQVFVPTDIAGLTRLDYLLGIQVLGVCWLMASIYLRDPATHEPPLIEPQPPTTPPPRRRPSRLPRGHAPRPPDGAQRPPSAQRRPGRLS